MSLKKKKIVHKKQCDSCIESGVQHLNPDYSKELNRLNRIAGQIEGIKKMITGRAYCPDILIQTKAIRSALKSLDTTILEKHIEHCVTDAFNSKDNKDIKHKINELMEIFKKTD